MGFTVGEISIFSTFYFQFFFEEKSFFEKVIIKIDRVINADVPRYRVFCLTPKNEEDTFDSLIRFFFGKKTDSPQEMVSIFKYLDPELNRDALQVFLTP